MHFRDLLVISVISLLSACNVSTNQSNPDEFIYPESGPAAALSEAEFNSLPMEKQLSVANKLYGTLYKGISAKDYFDFSKGTWQLNRDAGMSPLQNFRHAIGAPLESFYSAGDPNKKTHSDFVAEVEQKYFTRTDGRPIWAPMAVPLTYMYALPLSREHFNYWIAYQLANNILFSPALELESVDFSDVYTVYTRLVLEIGEDKPIRDIIFDHMQTEENWRRFRSPEDNTREMMEIYLMRFKDEEVPLAAKACQNWHLSGDDQNYQLLKTTNYNTEAQALLDTNNIVSCEDFMWVLSRHPSLVPAVTTRIVNQLLAGVDENVKTELVQGIVSANPKTFRELFAVLVNSTTYLLYAPRIKTLEETLFNAIARVQWQPSDLTFRNLTDPNPAASQITLGKMSQSAMTYKLGRSREVPVDTLSFAYYHNQVRDVLMNEKPLYANSSQGWLSSLYTSEELVNLSNEEFLDYLFLALLSRKAEAQEKTELLAIVAMTSDGNNRQRQTHLVFDYISRLPELYAFSH